MSEILQLWNEGMWMGSNYRVFRRVEGVLKELGHYYPDDTDPELVGRVVSEETIQAVRMYPTEETS